MDTVADNFAFSGDQSVTHRAAVHGPNNQTRTGNNMVIDPTDL